MENRYLKSYHYLYRVILITILLTHYAKGQQIVNNKNQSYYFITASACLSLKSIIATSTFGAPTKSSNAFDITVQKKAAKSLNFGASYSQQKFTTDDNINSSSAGKAYVITTLYNPGILASYCYAINNKFEIYAQTKLNYMIIKREFQYTITSINKTSSVVVPEITPNQFNFQFGLGTNLYISKNIGFHFEGAIGNPYMLKLGVNLRFGAQSDENKPKIKKVEPLKNKNIYN